MAERKKKTTRKSTKKEPKAKKERKQEKNIEYADFVKTVQKDIIMKHIDEIVNICEQFPEFEQMDSKSWNKINEIILEVCQSGRETEYGHGRLYYSRSVPTKMASTYSMAHRVREMQRKKFILDLFRQMKEKGNEEHYCNLIYCHLFILTEENARVVKESQDSEKKKKS